MSDKKCCNKPSIGGQAVIEGIMMKGPKKTVLAVRHITTGEIIIEDVSFSLLQAVNERTINREIRAVIILIFFFILIPYFLKKQGRQIGSPFI